MNVFVVFVATSLVYIAHRFVVHTFVERYISGWLGWDHDTWVYNAKVSSVGRRAGNTRMRGALPLSAPRYSCRHAECILRVIKFGLTQCNEPEFRVRGVVQIRRSGAGVPLP